MRPALTLATAIWLAAPLLGRIGPFLYPFLALLGLRKGGRERIAGLWGFLLLAALYAGLVALMAVVTVDQGTRILPPVRPALHLFIPVLIAAMFLRAADCPPWRYVTRGAASVLLATWAIGLHTRLSYGIVQPELLASNPLYLGASVIFPAVICLFPRDGGSLDRVVCILAVAAAGHLLMAVTGSRAYFLLLVLLVAIRIFAASAGRFGAIRSGIVTVAASIALVGVAFAIAPDHAKGRFSALADIPALAVGLWTVDPASVSDQAEPISSDLSLRLRMSMIIASLSAFAEAPLLGHGAHDVYQAAVPYMPDATAQTTNLHHLHNEIANQAVAHGIIGLALMLALVAYPIWHAWRLGVLRAWPGGFAALTSLASFGIGFGNVLLMADYPAYLFAVNSIGAIMAISAAAAGRHRREAEGPPIA